MKIIRIQKGGSIMNIASFQISSLTSLKQALGIAALRKSMNQDASTIATLVNDMKTNSAKTMEHTLTPHKGSNIDIKI
jgi:hypothetical protein